MQHVAAVDFSSMKLCVLRLDRLGISVNLEEQQKAMQEAKDLVPVNPVNKEADEVLQAEMGVDGVGLLCAADRAEYHNAYARFRRRLKKVRKNPLVATAASTITGRRAMWATFQANGENMDEVVAGLITNKLKDKQGKKKTWVWKCRYELIKELSSEEVAEMVIADAKAAVPSRWRRHPSVPWQNNVCSCMFV
jgi:hypothetical protein